MSNWKDQIRASETAYEHFFPELSDHYDSSPTKTEQTSPYHVFLSKCGVPDLDLNQFVPTGLNPIDNQSRNHMEKLEYLETKFSELAERAADLRSRSIDPYCNHDKISRVQAEIAQMAGDLDKFQFENVDAIIPADARSGQDVIRARRKSLNRRCNLLRNEVEVSDNLIHQLITSTDEELLAYGSEFDCNSPDAPIAILTELQPDWSDMISLQKKAAMSAVCRRFCTSVDQAQVPLCDAVFEYLISPAGHAYSLEICRYDFAPNELKNILTFMCSRNRLRTELNALVLCDCGIDDGDCLLLSDYLPSFTSLQTLSLRRNCITSDGLAEITDVMAANEMKIECLQFDRNAVDAVGMVEVAQMLPKCPMLSSISFSYNPIGDIGMYFFLRGILNPKRHAIDTLPLPPDPEGLVGRIMAAYDITLAATGPEDDDTTDDSSSGPANFFDNEKSTSGYFEETKLNMIDMDDPYHDSQDEFRMGLSVDTRQEDSTQPTVIAVSTVQRRIRMMKNVLRAMAAFKEVASRGHVIYALRAEGCELSPYATLMIAHALKDNTYVTDIFLGNNDTLLSTPDACLCMADLLQHNNIRILDIKNTGVDDTTARSLSQGVAKSTRIQSVDVSFNAMSATGATWFTGATGDMFFDHFAISTTPSQSYAVDIL